MMNDVDKITGKRLTKKQLKLLMTLNPFKRKKIYSEVAIELGVSKSAVQATMCRIKKRCPGIYWKFRQLRKDMTAGQKAVNYPIVMDPDFIEELNSFDKVKESF
jgi:hypothetical protein